MATVTSYTQAQVDELYSTQADQISAIDAASIDSASIDEDGNFTLTRKDASVINAGQVISSPTGSIVMYGGLSAPTGWLLCNGTAVSRTTYSELFALIGTRFGIGDNSTTFNLPNLIQKFPRMDPANVGIAGGTDTHSHAIPNHDHNLEGGSVMAHARARIITGSPDRIHMQQNSAPPNWNSTHTATPSSASAVVTTSIDNAVTVGGMTAQTGLTGASDTHVPPYLNLNFIIKT